jgi:hypothetical protein
VTRLQLGPQQRQLRRLQPAPLIPRGRRVDDQVRGSPPERADELALAIQEVEPRFAIGAFRTIDPPGREPAKEASRGIAPCSEAKIDPSSPAVTTNAGGKVVLRSLCSA